MNSLAATAQLCRGGAQAEWQQGWTGAGRVGHSRRQAQTVHSIAHRACTPPNKHACCCLHGTHIHKAACSSPPSRLAALSAAAAGIAGRAPRWLALDAVITSIAAMADPGARERSSAPDEGVGSAGSGVAAAEAAPQASVTATDDPSCEEEPGSPSRCAALAEPYRPCFWKRFWSSWPPGMCSRVTPHDCNSCSQWPSLLTAAATAKGFAAAFLQSAQAFAARPLDAQQELTGQLLEELCLFSGMFALAPPAQPQLVQQRAAEVKRLCRTLTPVLKAGAALLRSAQQASSVAQCSDAQLNTLADRVAAVAAALAAAVQRALSFMLAVPGLLPEVLPPDLLLSWLHASAAALAMSPARADAGE